MAGNEDVSNFNLKAICCEKIPEIFLDKLVAKKHFSQFGRVNRFILRPSRLCCTVEYETEDEAHRALQNAGQYNDYSFSVSYAKREVKQQEQNTEEWINAEVQSELEAMSPMGFHNSHAKIMAISGSALRAAQRLMPAPMAAPIVRQSRPMETNINTNDRVVQSGVRQELEALLRKPALTDEAKFRVLDARDKLLRLTQVRTTDIKKASKTIGTCPDMCPEKERLMREFQRQVSYFESSSSNSGSISHKKAIKEYSRSSADQEIPLSHELRPERVLRMTMLYLLHEIVDLCNQPDISLADWYHFLWDRTRSIRKDITQQELCSLETVQLVEQCARFHIHCAARLVAEDYAVFDKKINAENLTKCLQTLKYMYHDLRLKEIHCPCEAEFRSYIVLLNLGNANFLWELRQLPQIIQDATEIKRAICFYNALQNNNYTRFFAMIRSPETSYLSACILLGYFNRLRFNALNVINKSYNWRKYGIYMPTQYFVKILGFESIEAAVNFLHCHGIQCNQERVMLGAPQQPDSEYCMERALQLVEAKRQVSVGECIAGLPLESAEIYLKHEPHNSFDVYGLLKPEAWTAIDQNEHKLKTEKVDRMPSASTFKQLEKPAALAQPLAPLGILKQQPAIKPNIFGNFQRVEPQHQQMAKSITANTAATTFNFANYLPKDDKPATSLSNFQGNIFNIKPLDGANIAAAGGSIFSKPFSQQPEQKGTHDFTPLFSGFSTSNNKSQKKIYSDTDHDDCDDDDDNVIDEQEDNDDEDDDDDDEDDDDNDDDNDMSNEDNIDEDDDDEMEEEEESLLRADEEAEEEIKFMRKQKEADLIELKYQKSLNDVEKQANYLYNTLITEAIDNIARNELDECQALNDACIIKAQGVLNKYIAVLVEDIAKEELRLHKFSHKTNMLLRTTFQQWLSLVRRKKQKRKILQSLPVFITTETREQQTANIYMPNLIDNLDMIKRYRYGTACDFPKLLWSCSSSDRIEPVQIFHIIAKHLPQLSCSGRVRVRKYFKLLITLSAEQEELFGFKSLCESWLKQLLGPAIATTMMTSNDEGYYICALQHDVALCVRKVSGISNISNEMEQPAWQGECDHADAIMCFMSSAYIEEAGVRLHNLFGHGRNYKKLPVAIMLHNTGQLLHDAKTIVENIYLHQLTSKYKFYDFSKCHVKQFEAALSFLAQHVDQESTELLEMQNLRNWLDSCIGQEMWQNFHKSAIENPAFRQACTIPMKIVNLYNEALTNLQDILEQDFTNCAEFPKELREFVPTDTSHDLPLGLEYFPSDWKTKLNGQKSAIQMLEALKLPDLQEAVFNDLDELGAWCENSTLTCLKNGDEIILEKAYECIRNFLLWCDNFPHVNFLPIIRDLAHLHAQVALKQLKDLPNIIIYKRQALVEFLQQPWWLNFPAVAEIDLSVFMQEEPNETQDEHMKMVMDNKSEDVASIMEQAAGVLEKVETNENLYSLKNSRTIEQNENYVELHKCFRNYELTKLMGNYNIPKIEKRHGDPLSANRDNIALDTKRKCPNPNSKSEINTTISKAMALIEKLESN